MATVKSYTDLEQSKKLAEILSLESADMYYPNRIDIKYQGALPIEYKHRNPLLSQEIAAWSLAALLGVLPRIEDCKPVLDLEINYVQYPSDINLSATADNPVDACVNMIIKLSELKML